MREYSRLFINGRWQQPVGQGMAEVIEAFARVRQGEAPPLCVDGCNGYWHGQAGMLRVEEVGLC